MTVSTALAAINTPLWTTTAGAAAAISLPGLQSALAHGGGSLNWRLLNLAAFGLNYYAVRQPGRLDGSSRAGAETTSSKDSIANLLAERDKTLVMPKNWAFVIWAPIFLGEFALTIGALLFLKDGSSTAATLLRQASAGFSIANIFSTLWAATFRPKYIALGGAAPWISAGMLTGIAASLSLAHKAYAESPICSSIGTANYLLYFLPITMFFGWTSAASLVNWNGNVAMLCSDEKVVARAAWASIVAATAVGVGVTFSRSAPVFGAVIAWALVACADGMKDRLAQRDTEIADHKKAWWFQKKHADDEGIMNRKGYYGAEVQKWLCTAGAILSGSAAVLTLLKPNNVAP